MGGYKTESCQLLYSFDTESVSELCNLAIIIFTSKCRNLLKASSHNTILRNCQILNCKLLYYLPF